MRIIKVELIKLFGVFDHVISLNLHDRITIIHGPNGYGKTALLMMIQALLTNNFSRLKHIEFEKFQVDFDDNRSLSVRKSHTKKGEKKRSSADHLHFKLHAGKDSQEFIYEGRGNAILREMGYPLEMLERNIPDITRVSSDSWIQMSTGKKLDLEEVLESYPEFLHLPDMDERKRVPEWLRNIAKNFDVRLIEAQRLLSVPAVKRVRHSEQSFAWEPSVSSYSKELAATVQEIQARYGTSSQQLDSTFPTRAIQVANAPALSEEELKTKLTDLERQRQRIIAAGLLTTKQNYAPIFDPGQAIDDATKKILSLYSFDIERKLSIFRDVTERVELFKELVNKRFSYKKLDVEGEEGFQFHSTQGAKLLPSDLSSGEQHELVLLYELLFKTKKNAIILIDEPELSLHVAWQVEFLKDLTRVIKLSSFDAILATHSPQIINDRWDLAVELKGP
jgi:predicted ATPase